VQAFNDKLAVRRCLFQLSPALACDSTMSGYTNMVDQFDFGDFAYYSESTATQNSANIEIYEI
jgi:hypothetical protein